MPRDWIIHNFLLDDNQSFYSPGDIAYNYDVNNINYTIYLDTNIYQFIINSFKKEANQTSRDVIALIVFCQICNIQIEPKYAIYEKINYKKELAIEVIQDLNIFHKINNSSTKELIAYAIGKSDKYLLGDHVDIDIDTMKEKLTRYDKLTEWDSMYLIMLACVSFSMKNISNEEKLKMFVNWMIKDFRQSLVGYIYAIVYFKCPLKRMMKYKKAEKSEEKRKSISNMAWDLYIMNSFFRNWSDSKKESEFVYASDDKALRSLLRVAIDVQINGSFEPLEKIVPKSDYNNVMKIWNIKVTEVERVYGSKKWTREYMTKLIESFERELFS
ncbi:MAG: hypothetical protein WBF48_13515 [Halarcobacter sp.]